MLLYTYFVICILLTFMPAQSSLPGKVAPVTSGEMIADTILNILSEREVE